MTTYSHEFVWAGHGDHVVATGTFDNWSSSLLLHQREDGKFSASKDLPLGEKILYKYVVDGQWQHNPHEANESDGSGNINNVFTVPSQAVHPVLPIIPLAEPPVNDTATDKAVTGENPSEPTHTPAVGLVGTPTSTPTIPTNADIAEKMEDDPLPASSGSQTTEAPLLSSAPSSGIIDEKLETKALPVTSGASAPETASTTEEHSDMPVLAAASAGVGALLAGAAVVGQKAYESAAGALGSGQEAVGSSADAPIGVASKDAVANVQTNGYQYGNKALASGKEAVGSSADAPIDVAAKDASVNAQENASTYTQQATEAVSGAYQSAVSSPVGQQAAAALAAPLSFGYSTLAAMGLGGASGTQTEAAKGGDLPAPDAAVTPIPLSEAPAAEPTPNQAITSIPVSEAPAASALTTANGGSALEEKSDKVLDLAASHPGGDALSPSTDSNDLSKSAVESKVEEPSSSMSNPVDSSSLSNVTSGAPVAPKMDESSTPMSKVDGSSSAPVDAAPMAPASSSVVTPAAPATTTATPMVDAPPAVAETKPATTTSKIVDNVKSAATPNSSSSNKAGQESLGHSKQPSTASAKTEEARTRKPSLFKKLFGKNKGSQA